MRLQLFETVPAPAGLIGWWRAESSAQDSAGTNHGIIRGGAGFSTGQVGQAFSLDGIDDSIEIPDAPALRPVSLTIEAWVAFDAITGQMFIFAKPVNVFYHVREGDPFGDLKSFTKTKAIVVRLIVPSTGSGSNVRA
jgi:hypothetical protein